MAGERVLCTMLFALALSGCDRPSGHAAERVGLPFVAHVVAPPPLPPSRIAVAIGKAIQDHPGRWHMSDDNPNDTNLYMKKDFPDTVINGSGGCVFAQIDGRYVIDLACSTPQAKADSAYVASFYLAWVKANPRDMEAVKRAAAKLKAQEGAEDATRIAQEARNHPDPVKAIEAEATRP